jgi:hypothetical protein
MAKWPAVLSILSLFSTAAYPYNINYLVNSKADRPKIEISGEACWHSGKNAIRFYGRLKFERIFFSVASRRISLRRNLEFNVYSDDSISVQGNDTLRLADYPKGTEALKVIKKELKEKNPENHYTIVTRDSAQRYLEIATYYDKSTNTLYLKSEKPFLFGLSALEIKAGGSPTRETIPATMSAEYSYGNDKIPITFSFNGYSSKK